MIKAEIVAHSLNQQGDELISVLATFPRIILAEVNTHRMLSKNTSSSRAIPFGKMVEAVRSNPFIPIAWQKEHSGMQGTEYITNQEDINKCISTHLTLRDLVVVYAEEQTRNGATKQISNRYLEPFMWTTMLITGSKEGWDNFFRLRCPSYTLFDFDKTYKSRKEAINSIIMEGNKAVVETWDNLKWLQQNKGQAEIHMMALAEAIWDAKNESTPIVLEPGEWHIPFGNKILIPWEEDSNLQSNTIKAVKISTAMSARTSYTVVGEEKEINLETLIGLHDRLITQQPPHSSPMEHCCRAMNIDEYSDFVKGSRTIRNNNLYNNPSSGWCTNIKGFIPYRYFLDNNLTL